MFKNRIFLTQEELWRRRINFGARGFQTFSRRVNDRLRLSPISYPLPAALPPPKKLRRRLNSTVPDFHVFSADSTIRSIADILSL